MEPGISPAADPSTLLAVLQLRTDALEDAVQKQEDLQRLLIQAEAREREARRRRDPALEFEQLDAMGITAIAEMAQYRRRLSSYTGRQSAQDAFESWLGAGECPGNLDALRAGTECLSAWLASAPRT